MVRLLYPIQGRVRFGSVIGCPLGISSSVYHRSIPGFIQIAVENRSSMNHPGQHTGMKRFMLDGALTSPLFEVGIDSGPYKF